MAEQAEFAGIGLVCICVLMRSFRSDLLGWWCWWGGGTSRASHRSHEWLHLVVDSHLTYTEDHNKPTQLVFKYVVHSCSFQNMY